MTPEHAIVESEYRAAIAERDALRAENTRLRDEMHQLAVGNLEAQNRAAKANERLRAALTLSVQDCLAGSAAGDWPLALVRAEAKRRVAVYLQSAALLSGADDGE